MSLNRFPTSLHKPGLNTGFSKEEKTKQTRIGNYVMWRWTIHQAAMTRRGRAPHFQYFRPTFWRGLKSP